jgi:hypothetical protein
LERARNRVISEQSPDETAGASPVVKSLPVLEQQPAPKVPEKGSKERTLASLEAVLERVVGRNKPIMEEEVKPRPAPTRARSKAEQELLDMLKTGIKG